MIEAYPVTCLPTDAHADDPWLANRALERENAELHERLERLSRRYDDLNSVMSAGGIIALLLDDELCIRTISPFAAQAFGIDEGDIGRPIASCEATIGQGAIERDARKVLAGCPTPSCRIADSDGRAFEMTVRPARDATGFVAGVVVTLVDVTEQHAAAVALQASEDRYRLLFDSIDAGFCVIEMIWDDAGEPVDYRFLDVNAAFERQTGMQDAVGRMMSSFVPDLERFWFESYGEIARTGVPQRFENPAAGLNRYYEVYAFRFGDPAAGQVGVLFNDVGVRHQAEIERELLTEELSHRVMNTLGVVQALARRSGGPAATIEEYRGTFLARLQALARSHRVLLNERWRGAPMARLVAEVLEPYRRVEPAAIVTTGPDVDLTIKQGLALGLLVHELVANAERHGALSTPSGRVAFSWEVTAQEAPTLRLVWTECGGPVVRTPPRANYGTELIHRVARYELGGSAAIDYAPDGVVCAVTFPLRETAGA